MSWRLASLTLIYAISFAAPAANAGCSLASQLFGDPNYTWSQGHDAWQGSGTITCGDDSIFVFLRFESDESGVGAPTSSIIEIRAELDSLHSPLDLLHEIDVIRTSPLNETTITWESRTPGLTFTFQVSGEARAGRLNSLSRGSLHIYVPNTPGRGR